MSGYLGHLVERTLGLMPSLQARPRSRFEPLAAGVPVTDDSLIDGLPAGPPADEDASRPAMVHGDARPATPARSDTSVAGPARHPSRAAGTVAASADVSRPVHGRPGAEPVTPGPTAGDVVVATATPDLRPLPPAAPPTLAADSADGADGAGTIAVGADGADGIAAGAAGAGGADDGADGGPGPADRDGARHGSRDGRSRRAAPGGRAGAVDPAAPAARSRRRRAAAPSCAAGTAPDPATGAAPDPTAGTPAVVLGGPDGAAPQVQPADPPPPEASAVDIARPGRVDGSASRWASHVSPTTGPHDVDADAAEPGGPGIPPAPPSAGPLPVVARAVSALNTPVAGRPVPSRAPTPQASGPAPAPTKVTVTIGRVEVRPPPVPPPVAEPPPGPPPLSLDEYLERRGGRSP